jgi:hypothetical protein
VIFCSIGLPGGFAEWCEATLVKIAEVIGGRVALKVWPSVEEMLGYRPLGDLLREVGLALIAEDVDQVVIGARQPDERLRLALAEADVPFILALEDPRHAVADIVARSGIDAVDATRAVANSCPFVMRYTAMTRALSLVAEEVRLNPAAAVSAIAGHFGVPLSADTAAEIARELSRAGIVPEANRGMDQVILGERVTRIVDGALSGYGEFFAGRPMRQFTWSRELFLVIGDSRRPTEPIDVAGGSRYLIYGPYIHLPPGSWSARIVLGFSTEAVGNIFLVDACYANRQIGAVSFRAENAGMHTAEINFSLSDAGGQGVEIRVMVMSEQAHGWLAFGQASLTPLSLSHPDAAKLPSEGFEAVLEL